MSKVASTQEEIAPQFGTQRLEITRLKCSFGRKEQTPEAQNPSDRRIVCTSDGKHGRFQRAHLCMQPCATYKATCQLEWLLADDSEWCNAMADGVGTLRPSQLRQLFATLLLYCDVGDPTQLWHEHGHEYKDHMAEDFAKRRRATEQVQPTSIYARP